MKKIFTLVSFFLLLVAGAWAQTPNPSFDTWTSTGFPAYEEPNSWHTANAQTNIISLATCIKASGADKHTGTYAIKLVTKQIGAPFNQLVPGFATTGTLPSSITGPLTGGIPYTSKPDSIVGYYKYTPQGGENGFIAFIIFGSAANNADTIAKAGFATPTVTVGSFTRFAAPLVYTASVNPVVNSMWLLSSSNNNGLASSIGSTLFVDDLSVVINPSTTSVAEQNMPEVSLGPNPATDFVLIKNELSAKAFFSLYDLMGRKITTEAIGSSENTIDVSFLNSGLYLYAVTDENNATIETGKLIIQ